MAFAVSDLAVPTSVAAGPAVALRPDESATVYLTGTFTATVQMQVSLDGTNWLNDGSALTAAGTLLISKAANYVRANVTAYTSGTPVGKLLHG